MVGGLILVQQNPEREVTGIGKCAHLFPDCGFKQRNLGLNGFWFVFWAHPHK